MADKRAMLALSATELRRRIGSKEISPVELLDACFERIAEVNPAVNAITGRDDAAARAAAHRAETAVLGGEELGALHGLPVGIKDLDETGGLLTTHGSPIHRNHVPAADNAMVANVRAAGAIIAGKTNVPEFGAGANTVNAVWGATGNAFDPDLTAAGSSGGSAVALATDMLPLCTGSDTGGSLRTPAAYNGIVGFRPSPGLVPYSGRGIGWTPISVLGPMARTVEDLSLLLSAQAGFDPREPLGFPGMTIPATPDPVDLSTLRVGLTEDFGCCAVAEEVRSAFREKTALMKSHFRSVTTLDADFSDAHFAFDVIRGVNFLAKHLPQFQADPSRLGEHVRANVEFALKLSATDMVRAQAVHTQLFRRFQAQFQEVDLILAPMAAVPPRPWREPAVMEIDGKPLDIYYRWLGLAYVPTLATNPALSLPVGRHANGLPFGLQMIGPFRGDRRLIAMAHALEKAIAAHPALARPLPDEAVLRHARPDLRAVATHPPDMLQPLKAAS